MKIILSMMLFSSALLFVSCEDQEYNQEVGLLQKDIPLIAGKNLPDRHDQNEVPAELEERQNEEVNLTDMVDKNQTPDVMEERAQEEKWRKDYEDMQYDDPARIKKREY